MNSIPPAMVGPGPLIAPPLAATPLTVEYSCAALYSQMILPSAAAYARMIRVIEPEKITPGITLIAADCDWIQLGSLLFRHGMGGGRVNQTLSPFWILTAAMPPACSGPQFASALAKYTSRPSVAEPHWIPPSVLPLPTRCCQMTAPCFSGSSAHPIPDFCPATRISRPLGSLRRIGELPKSKSGPGSDGHVSERAGLFLSQFPKTYASFSVSCLVQITCPVLRSNAMTASEVGGAGAVLAAPVAS